MPVTIRDVAKYAGVSIATVSCALSGSKNVKPETKALIQDAIQALKYIPNASARDLKMERTNEIGVVFPDLDDAFYMDILKGIKYTIEKKGMDLSVKYSGGTASEECDKIDKFIGKNVAGLIVLTCQPQNSAFFRDRLANFDVPVVYLDRKPALQDFHYVGFDNYTTVLTVTRHFISSGYRSLALFCGNPLLSSEDQCINGFRKALSEQGTGECVGFVYYSELTVESAFKTTFSCFEKFHPQAVIASSGAIAKAVMEAAYINEIKVPEDLVIFSLGEETWRHTNTMQPILHSARNAQKMGSVAAELLWNAMKSPSESKKQQIILEDSILKTELPALGMPHRKKMTPAASRPSLEILAMDMNTSTTIRFLAGDFTRQTGVGVNITLAQQNQLMSQIIEDAEQPEPRFDLYMVDIPWIPYLAQKGVIANISDFINGMEYNRNGVLQENLENCKFAEEYYGVPVVGGSQLLLYRRDLFENVGLRKSYEKQYNLSLRPPKTWTEFNHVAEFFTRSFNPSSPTMYGATFAGAIHEELIPELLIRMWACGGRIFDKENNVCLHSAQNVEAIKSILQSLPCVAGHPLSNTIYSTVQSFYTGVSAMIITYTEYAAEIKNGLNSGLIGKVGYSIVPGRTPVSIGWGLSLNPSSQKSKQAYEFLKWLSRGDISYYMTVLDGQTAISDSYANNELLNQYPWMGITLENFKYCRKRVGPYRKGLPVIPQNKIEAIVCNAFINVVQNGMEIEEALELGQMQMMALFSQYGY